MEKKKSLFEQAQTRIKTKAELETELKSFEAYMEKLINSNAQQIQIEAIKKQIEMTKKKLILF